MDTSRLRALLRPLTLTLTLALLFFATAARASDDEASKLETRGKALRYVTPTTSPKNKIDTGGAAIFVDAPIAVVRKIVTDYGRYKKIVTPFHQSRVLTKQNGVSDVYLDVPVAHGAINIWAVVKIGEPVKSGDEEVVSARFVKGNINDFRAVWRMRAVDAEHTVLKLEILVDPKLPLPASMVTPELQYAADRAVTAVRDDAQKRAGRGPKAKPSPVATDASPAEGKTQDVAKR